MEIRDKRLYRQEFATFEDYCRQRWQMSRIHAHRLIEAAGVIENLLPMGNIPTNERVARPLAKLKPEQQREAWQLATMISPNPTAAADAQVEFRVASVVSCLSLDLIAHEILGD